MIVFLDNDKIFPIKGFKLGTNVIITEYGDININTNTTLNSVWQKVQTAIKNGDNYIDLSNDTNINYQQFVKNFKMTAENLISITTNTQLVENESWYISGSRLYTKDTSIPISINNIKTNLKQHSSGYMDLRF